MLQNTGTSSTSLSLVFKLICYIPKRRQLWLKRRLLSYGQVLFFTCLAEALLPSTFIKQVKQLLVTVERMLLTGISHDSSLAVLRPIGFKDALLSKPLLSLAGNNQSI